MTIEICLDNYKVIVEDGILYINDKKRKVLPEEIDKLVNYTINWKNEYINNNVFEAEEYTIKIGDKLYIFKGSYPANYSELINYLGELYDNR